jgi:hypothetical protein
VQASQEEDVMTNASTGSGPGRLTATRLLLAVVAVSAAGAAAIAQDDDGRQVFSAFAVSTGGPRSSPIAEQVIIGIDRWTTTSQQRQLADALKEQGAEGLLDELQDLPDVGYIRTPDSLGYRLHYAAQEPLPDGGRRIVLATARPISFWERWRSARTLDYPFTVVELQLGADGTGEGKLSMAAKVIAFNGRMILENWAVAPVQLNKVQRQSE